MGRIGRATVVGVLLAEVLAGCGKNVEVGREQYANGKPKLEYEYYTDGDGNRVNSGYYREYFESGALRI